MNPRPVSSPIRALAAAASALVQSDDITAVLADLLQHTAAALGAEAVGLLVVEEEAAEGLELLASTSHAVSELELYQAQSDEGPCIDCLRSLDPVTVLGEQELVSRWPTVGPVMVASGYRGVHTEPLRWHGRVLGGLNVFLGEDSALGAESRALARAFADITTLALVQTQGPSDHELTAHIREALDARRLVEQAKGVLMQTRGLDPATAYTALRTQAVDQGLSFTELARNLVWQAHSP